MNYERDIFFISVVSQSSFVHRVSYEKERITLKRIFICILCAILLSGVCSIALADSCEHHFVMGPDEDHEYTHISLTDMHIDKYKQWFRCTKCFLSFYDIRSVDKVCSYSANGYVDDTLYKDSSQHWYIGNKKMRCPYCGDWYRGEQEEHGRANHTAGALVDYGHVESFHIYKRFCTLSGCNALVISYSVICNGNPHIAPLSLPMPTETE